MRTHFPFVALALLALASCATPIVYGPIGQAKSPYGYKDTRNSDGSITIMVVANSAAMAKDYWDRRAGELCGAAEIQKNIFRAEIPVYQFQGYAASAYGAGYPGGSYSESRYGNFIMEGYLRCGAPGPAKTSPHP